MDFTLITFKSFLETLISSGYSFILFKVFINSETNNNSNIILRHDVDNLPQNALRTAEIEHSLGIKGSYYFRILKSSFNVDIIKKISELGHEIGYHYEDVDLARKKISPHSGMPFAAKGKSKKINENQLIDLAYESFCENLEKMRRIADIKTICAHGSPLSPYDNKMIWNKYNYKKLGIIGEPSFDVDWNEFAYFTDTGRRWNGDNVSVRDRVNSNYKFNFKSTNDIINNINTLPSHIMITVHPQRWNDNIFSWTKELVTQAGKNVIKKYFFVKRQ